MTPATQSPWKYIILWLRIVFATHPLYSGLAFVFTQRVPKDMRQALPGAGTFMVALVDIGLDPIVEYPETLVGLMLLLNFAVPLALILEMPISVVIFCPNVFVEGTQRRLFTGPPEPFLNGVLLLAYCGTTRASCTCVPVSVVLGRFQMQKRGGDGGAASARRTDPGGRSMKKNDAIVSAVAVEIMIATVLLPSYLLGPEDRRLPPRDYLPLAIATVVMVVTMIQDRKRGD